MPFPSSVSSQAGCKKETTYGLAVTPDRFWPVVPGAFIEAEVDTIESAAVIAGYGYTETGQSVLGMVKAAGSVGFEVYDRALGLIFESIMGSVNTTGAGPYTHTFTRGALPSYTWQFGLPQNDGTVIPSTATGVKVTGAELSAQVGEIATLGLDLVAQNLTAGTRSVSDGVTTNASAAITSATAVFTQADPGKVISGTGITTGTQILSVQSATAATLSANATATGTAIAFVIGRALATASYPSGLIPVRFQHGVLAVAGTDAKPSQVSVKWDNGLAAERSALGSNVIREPLESDNRSAVGTATCEFDSLTHYDLYRAGTDVAVSLAFTVGTYSLTIAGNARLTSVKQGASGKGMLSKELEYSFRRTAGGADSTAMTVTLVNGDSTP